MLSVRITQEHLIKAMIISIIAVLSAIALKLAMADVFSLSVNRALHNWEDTPPTRRQLEQVRRYADHAGRLSGETAHALILKARVLEWDLFLNGEDKHKQNTLDLLYKKAARLQPASVDVWLSLIRSKIQRREFDGEFEYFVRQATTAGPFNEQANLTLARVLLNDWQDINAGTAQLLMLHARRALNFNHGYAIFRYARQVNKLELLCSISRVAGSAVSTEYCSNSES